MKKIREGSRGRGREKKAKDQNQSAID